MNEKCNAYNKLILLDDDHKILKETQKMLGDHGRVFHISSIFGIMKSKIIFKFS